MSSTEHSTEVSDFIGLIHSIETFGVLDGPGIRYVIFMQGCPLKCIYCHNPDSRTINTGTPKKVDQIIKDVLKYKSFIKNGGITISGGEPLLQSEFCAALCDAAHKEGISVAIDTSGGIPLKICKNAIDKCDLLLLDIKSLDPAVYKNITGGHHIGKPVKMLKYCEEISKKVWIRHVIVPNINLRHNLLNELADFLAGFKCVEKIDILPFHKMGEQKWKSLGMDYTLYDTPEPTNEEILKAVRIFKRKGLNVCVGRNLQKNI